MLHILWKSVRLEYETIVFFINSCLLFAFYHDVSSHVGMCVFTNSIILHIDEIVQKSCYLQGMLP